MLLSFAQAQDAIPPDPGTELEFTDENASPETSAFVAKLASHTLTEAEMETHDVGSVDWNGRRIYMRRNQWIVSLSLQSPSAAEAESALNDLGFGPIYLASLAAPNSALVKVPEGVDYTSLSDALAKRGLLERVEPNSLGWADTTPNDTNYATKQWTHNNTGQTSGGVAGYTDADIDTSQAWDITQGSRGIVIGVIDTGLTYTHADLYMGERCQPRRVGEQSERGRQYHRRQ